MEKVDLESLESRSFLQSGFWAGFKKLYGWEGMAFTGEEEGKRWNVSVLLRRLGPFCFAYIPHGPEAVLNVDEEEEFLYKIGGELKHKLPKNCIFIRFDLPMFSVQKDGVVSRTAYRKPLRKGVDVQPPDSVILKLDKSEDELLAAMKSKWRYNIKLAEKKGVTVSEEGLAGLETFLELYEETGKRDAIAIHSREYYRDLFNEAIKANEKSHGISSQPKLKLWVARYEDQALASIITLYFGGQAVYLYGASGQLHRNLMPTYALQWKAICDAKKSGCEYWDFFGIPPADDPGHPMHGLYRFKTGFGGEIVHYPGAWDYPLKPFFYALYSLAERLRYYWYKTVKKRMRG